MSHTPGPWKVQPGTVGAGRVQIVSPSYRKKCDAEHVICELRPWQRPDCGPDAQLIAAAPELLDALKSLMELYFQGQVSIEGDDGEGSDPVVRDSLSAIAKAEGRSEQCAPTEG